MTRTDFLSSYASLESKLYAFAFKLTRNTPDAKDLMQETMVRGYTNCDKFRAGTNFKAWITTIMRNTFSNMYRKIRRRNETSEAVESYDSVLMNKAVFNLSESNIMVSELISIVEQLDEKYKIPFLMSYQGYDYQEISVQMNIPIGTVKSRLHTARQQLRVLVKSNYPKTLAYR